MTGHATITISGLSREATARLLGELSAHLSRLGIITYPGEQSFGDGQRGDASLLFQLAIGAVSGSSFVSLVNCIKSYITRDAKIAIEIRNKNGDTVKLTTQNVNNTDIKKLLESIVSTGGK
jgi:hypothetical protein